MLCVRDAQTCWINPPDPLSHSTKRLLEKALALPGGSFPSAGKSASVSVYGLGAVEPVTELIRPNEAWIVRCKYNSEVLVSCGDSALPMVDIDDCLIDVGGWVEAFSKLLAKTELNLQVRAYKTAHGYRLLVESQTLKPEGSTYELLARAFSCDASYLELCQKQKCFRARLTPKPEAESGAGTCRYLGTIGDAGIDEALAGLIQLHDKRTGALLYDRELG